MLNKIISILKGFKMSLHDVDKTNSNRITSALNSADDVQQRMAQGTTAIQNSSDPDEVDGLQFKERQVLAVQDGVNKAIIGFYGEANKFGLKVAEDGVDVLTATDDQLVFNSERNVFKILKVGTVEWQPVLGGGSSTTLEIPHGLGFAPISMVFYGEAGLYYPLPMSPSSTTGTADGTPLLIKQQEFSAYTTNTNLVILYKSVLPDPRPTASFKYYLLQETAG